MGELEERELWKVEEKKEKTVGEGEDSGCSELSELKFILLYSPTPYIHTSCKVE